jgi:hypothetical protein
VCDRARAGADGPRDLGDLIDHVVEASHVLGRTRESSVTCCGSTGGLSSLLRPFSPATAVFDIPVADEVVTKFGVARVAG